MTVKLGNIDLHENLRLYGIETAKVVAVSQLVSLGGVSSLQTMPLSGGRSLSLAAVQDGDTVKGRFTRAQVLAIKTMENAGQPVTLIHHLGTFSVLVVSTEDLVSVLDKAAPASDSWYTGTIQMIEV